MTRVCSPFSQILQLFSRLEFESAVRQHKAEQHARGFTCWGQFVAMLFCQLGHAQSLREICGGLAASEGKLKHLGLPAAPARSTLAYANEHRPWQLYQTVFEQLLQKCQQVVATQPGKKPRKFRFKNKLLSLDATVIALCASVPWGHVAWKRPKRHHKVTRAYRSSSYPDLKLTYPRSLDTATQKGKMQMKTVLS